MEAILNSVAELIENINAKVQREVDAAVEQVKAATKAEAETVIQEKMNEALAPLIAKIEALENNATKPEPEEPTTEG